MRLIRLSESVIRRTCRCFSSDQTAVSSAISVTQKQNEVFDREKERQLSLVKAIEKVHVKHLGTEDECSLMMNKYLSTPYHVAMHLGEPYCKHSGIAVVNGSLWHMLQPLQEDCELSFVRFKDDKPFEVNKAFWRSCSHLMGAVLQKAFKEEVLVEPVRTPFIPLSAGCFAYDVNIPFKWEPTREELVILSREAYVIMKSKSNFERLEVRPDVAMEIFEDNVYKKHFVEQLQGKGLNRVTLFRLGDFIDISRGPMMTNTEFFSPHRFVFTCVHSIDDYLRPKNKLLRFQGVALPAEFDVSVIDK
ncbi:large ribosomal subunit protein mL39-like [Amphiura filiformis]|uniref:large ribosomal subunit protein mL39-like n=1 Tax=Amphiura filiformis TaxID=82378 RepID=UPI003B20DBA7